MPCCVVAGAWRYIDLRAIAIIDKVPRNSLGLVQDLSAFTADAGLTLLIAPVVLCSSFCPEYR
jgi:hypothetical protein